ncbi:hypothetical protein IT41_18190 [Paracoccus halophilus]|uniref:Uncharacterized protein n=1 Tax=Paracoccus halophilus TaxID=376733 RepID=A0A099EW21_9RHOB|nr:hypothetical protein IT41_18190 [Paracoccus halophilus]
MRSRQCLSQSTAIGFGQQIGNAGKFCHAQRRRCDGCCARPCRAQHGTLGMVTTGEIERRANIRVSTRIMLPGTSRGALQCFDGM